jgi:hypothetical protein
MLSRIDENNFKCHTAEVKCFLAGKVKSFRLYKCILNFLNRPTYSQLADSVCKTNVKFSTVFTPIHQGQQKLI